MESQATGPDPTPTRMRRVRFKHPVRVVPIDGPPRAWRLLSANLSRKGMFLRVPNPTSYPLAPGARLALSLEAGGRVLPFAQAEVVWQRTVESAMPGRDTGVGVRFTGFLHPRAGDLVGYLVTTLDRGVPLRAAPPPPSWRPIAGWLGGGLALLAVLIASILALRSHSVDEVAEPAAALAQADVPPESPEPVQTEPARPAAAPAPTPAPPGEPVAAAPAEPSPELAAPEPPEPVEPPAEEAGGDAAGSEAAATVATLPPNSLALPSGAARALRWETARGELRVVPELAEDSQLARTFLLAGPPRLVFDLGGRAPARSLTLDATAPHVKRVRVGKQGGSTRVVLDLDRAPTDFVDEGGGAILSF